MVDWKSGAEIAKDAAAFDKFMHVLFGFYVWECCGSLHFDWQYISGERPFRWPMTFYFLNKYCLVCALVGILVGLNVRREIDCQALFLFNTLFGNASVGLASINLSLRTMAVWSRSWYIVVPLVVMILGQLSLLLHGVVVKAIWVPEQGCVIVNTNTTILVATWIYTMGFDFIVMLLTAVKLVQPDSIFRSRLVELIFRDGLIYFIVVFLANVVATALMLLNLNPVMSIIGNVPACVISTIVACRVVRRLSNFRSSGTEMLDTTSIQGTTLALGSQLRVSSKATNIGVNVQMETFQSPAAEEGTFVGRDSEGQEISYDPEPRPVRVSFKHSPSTSENVKPSVLWNPH